jgi:hypothetical protein
MPVILFRKEPKNPDLSLPNIHPPILDTRNNRRVVSVQEGNLVRVALYDGDFHRIVYIYTLLNPTGSPLTGLPAGQPKYAPEDNPFGVRFGNDIMLKPYVMPSKLIGSREWPNHLWWQRVYGNYYFVRLYRGEDIIWEGLFTEESGQDLRSILGESFENPSTERFNGAFAGSSIDIYGHLGRDKKFQNMRLIQVKEQDLPEDFPKDLVRWIP